MNIQSEFKAEYNVWRNINSRCHNPNDMAYRYYGARGIKVCKKWRIMKHGGDGDFIDFLNTMGERPSYRHSIDRIDNDGDYTHGNVQWATQKQQTYNRRTTCKITVDNKKFGSAKEVANFFLITQEAVRLRCLSLNFPTWLFLNIGKRHLNNTRFGVKHPTEKSTIRIGYT